MYTCWYRVAKLDALDKKFQSDKSLMLMSPTFPLKGCSYTRLVAIRPVARIFGGGGGGGGGAQGLEPPAGYRPGYGLMFNGNKLKKSMYGYCVYIWFEKVQ